MKKTWNFITKTSGVIATGAVLQIGPAFAAEVSQIPDPAITTTLEERLIGNSDVSLRQVEVRVENGVATLTGTADSIPEKKRAEEIAGSARGVRSVQNEIVVNPPPRDPGELREDIKAALRAEPSVSPLKLAILVKNGVVTIGGRVERQWNKRTVLDVVENVKGVRAIDDQIRIAKYNERPDDEIAEDVRDVLAADAWVNAGRIQVQVRNQQVILSGEVGSVAQKTRATLLAEVGGVRYVNARPLEVNPALPDTMRETVLPIPTEDEIRRAVNNAMQRDPRVAASAVDVDVNVDKRTVTLSGTLDDLAAVRAAIRAAQDTRGVNKVVSQLNVRPPAIPADENLAAEVKAALNRDPYLSDETIRIRTSLGVVFLSGKIDSEFLKERAEDIVARVPGVVTIANELDVRNEKPASRKTKAQPRPSASLREARRNEFILVAAAATTRDAQIRESIEEKLRSHPIVHADHINVHVLDGVATLTGNVQSVQELNAAIKQAREGGAINVRNNIRVKSGAKEMPREDIEAVKPQRGV